MAGAAERVHGTAVALAGRAALVRGASGAGKSDLALRCITAPLSAVLPHQAELIADDQVAIEERQGTLFASAPQPLRGLLEVRGLGIVRVPALQGEAPLALVVDLVPRAEIPRLPDPMPRAVVLGVRLPLLLLDPFESAAPQKLLLALARAGDGRIAGLAGFPG